MCIKPVERCNVFSVSIFKKQPEAEVFETNFIVSIVIMSECI